MASESLSSYSSGSIFKVLGVIVCLMLGRTALKRRRSHYRHGYGSLPYPPGPKAKPLIGNTLDFPKTQPWLTYTRWAKEFGSVVHIHDFTQQHIIIVNSLEDATELFEKRSHNYSDRPPAPIIELMGWDFATTFLTLVTDKEKWRRHRRLYQQKFKKESQTYRPIQTRKINDMLRHLLSTPEEFLMHCKTVTVAIIMSATYGHDISPTNDHYVYLSEKAVERLTVSVWLSAAIINAFPILRYVPSWLPGAGFKRFAEETKLLTDEMQSAPLKLVRENMASGSGSWGLAAELLEENDARGGSKAEEDIIKAVMATSYVGGADTSASALGTFFLAMIYNPEAQKKAQAEIDRVVGPHRLPTFDDRPSLPYTEALYREVMRWRTVIPLSAPHIATEDDSYKGYFIPKGAIIIPNLWAMAHDEVAYPNPDAFRPERHFDEPGNLKEDNLVIAFGFGKRICAGRHFASMTVWLAMVSVLSVFNLSKAQNADGTEIPVKGDYTDSMVSHPLPFPCSIAPRSNEARDLIIGTNLK